MITNAGGGNAVVVWAGLGNVGSGLAPLLVQEINALGSPLWTVGGVTAALPPVTSPAAVASDGSGGVIIAALSNPLNFPTLPGVVLQRVDTNGQNMWQTGGVSVAQVTTNQIAPTLLADGSGGVFVAWQNCNASVLDCDIFGQRVDQSGQLQWGAQGVSISSAPGLKLGQQIVSDGNNGVIVVWDDCRNEPSDLGTCYDQMDIYAQRLDGQGLRYWRGDGFPVSTAPGNQGFITSIGESSIALLPDGQSGVFVFWPDGRDGLCGEAAPSESRCEFRAQHVVP